MNYETPAIEDLGSIADHTFMPKANKPGNTDNNAAFPKWHPGRGGGHGSAPS